MSTIHKILEEFREAATSNRDMGDKFELLIAGYLITDPLYADRFSDVWLWTEWPDHGKQPDTGIDLVAKEKATGDYCAIQCKFYSPDGSIQLDDISTFFTRLGKTFPTKEGKGRFSSGLIVSTTDKWSGHAEEALQNQQIPVTRLRVQDLADSPVDWSKFSLKRPDIVALKKKKSLRAHQTEALDAVVAGFRKSDRGKLIMACGTGKTFTSLKIAERLAPSGGFVLFLVPSISLMSQSLREWTAEAEANLYNIAVCSDTKVGKRSENEDISSHDLAFPATTDVKTLAKQLTGLGQRSKKSTHKAKHLTIVFSTYQSIAVVAAGQKGELPEFDLIICDEAHRTTGVTLEGEDESHFVRVHDQKYLKGKKRLYMTATPRIYSDAVQTQAKEANAELCSMDNEAMYGPEFHRLGFSESISRDLLSDYKVMVLAVDEKYVSKAFQSQLSDKHNELNLEDATKIAGCWNGLSKRLAREAGAEGFDSDPAPMRRAVAFSRSIKDSKRFTTQFVRIVEDYQKEHSDEADLLGIEVEHVDGTFNALVRNQKLDWLKEDTYSGPNICRVLSNARCLSEGVDVPALDAVMFLNPRNSIVDVVQSVGRVMRKSPGKKYGYIILPIGIPADVSPEEALKDNQKYKVVWQVLQALRAHDDRFNATINQLELNKHRPDQIQVIGVSGGFGNEDRPGDALGTDHAATGQYLLQLPYIEEWRDAIYARIVVKCGDRRYWESWAKDVSKIAERHISRIKGLLESADEKPRRAFAKFLAGLQINLNPAVSETDAIEMLAQHLITQPVFDALFEDYAFTESNPVSRSMEAMLAALHRDGLTKDQEQLESFYSSVRSRANGIDNAEGKQRVIVELYDTFFRTAFPRMAERLGIVYTPVEVVDFILKSADYALQREFGVGLTDTGVHILDPFTGTGTFTVRLLQGGFVRTGDLLRKYTRELHANEIVLLAYYIAAVNIEAAWHGQRQAAGAATNYLPFEGIVLTDTFQLTESKGSLEEKMFPDNNQRAKRQSAVDIRVIVGNPPYSVGIGDDERRAINSEYPRLDERIRDTYAQHSNATNKNSLYDSYIRALRWASDRLKNEGIICFVTNGYFIDGAAADGLRKSLADEFSSIYCFNLRGNQRTSGETSRKEGGKIFGSGSRASVAISLLVKKSRVDKGCRIFYYDIGDYLTREEKLKIIASFSSIAEIPWVNVTPNVHHDWINQRDSAFDAFWPMGDKGDSHSLAFFGKYSRGLESARDSWVYNFSRRSLASNVDRTIAHFNTILRAAKANAKVSFEKRDEDGREISWSSSLKGRLQRFQPIQRSDGRTVESVYRPYCKQWLYFDEALNHRTGKMQTFFPASGSSNLVICTSGVGNRVGFSALITNVLPDLHMVDGSGASHCFALIDYSKQEEDLLTGNSESESERRSNITDTALRRFQTVYDSAQTSTKSTRIAKEDLFYYIYGVLHAQEYRDRFGADLKKLLPRIPYSANFQGFCKAGRELAKWHLDYESVDPYPLIEEGRELALDPTDHYRVQKMTFGKADKGIDRTVIHYNSRVTLRGIPLEAYEYVVNGKSAIEWIMERYQVTKDKESQIVNDPNDWCTEHGDAKYIVNLVKRIVRVSLETVRIVTALPALREIGPPPTN